MDVLQTSTIQSNMFLCPSKLLYFQKTFPSINLLAVLNTVAFSTSPRLLNLAPTTSRPLGWPMVSSSFLADLPGIQAWTIEPGIRAATDTLSPVVIGSALCG